jgi:dihydrofolate reductase
MRQVPLPNRTDAVLTRHTCERDPVMSKLRVNNFALSLEGYGAGPRQDSDNPLGVGGERLHEWFHPTRTFKAMTGEQGGSSGVDDDFARRGMENVGAWIMGRNMFGPLRGAWKDETWKGWWGDNPPYHAPVFVLTHHARKSIEMEGSTTFHFVTQGIQEALRQAKHAAGSRDIRIGGGVETIRQYLREGLIDELHLAIAPVLLGTGEQLFSGLDLTALGYGVSEHVTSKAATHVVLTRR